MGVVIKTQSKLRLRSGSKLSEVEGSIECFRVLAKDIQDGSYFVKNLTSPQYLWCYADHELLLREEVYGRIQSPQYQEDLPLLAITPIPPEEIIFINKHQRKQTSNVMAGRESLM